MEQAIPLAYRVVIPFILGLSALIYALFLGLLIQRIIRDVRGVWQQKRRAALMPLIVAYAEGDVELDDVKDALHLRDRAVLKKLLLDSIIEVKGEYRARLSHLLLEFGFVVEEIKRLGSRQWWIREDAAVNLGLMDSKRAIVPLRALLGDPVDDVRLQAARSLGELGDAEALPHIIASLGASSRWIISTIEEIVLDVGKKANPYLLGYLEGSCEEDAPVLPMVIELLGSLQVREATEQIARYLSSERLELRVAAAKTLGQFADPEMGQALLPSLQDPSWEVRAQAAKAFAYIQAHGAIAPLRECLADRNWWVRYNAAHALRAYGNEGVEALVEALQSIDPFSRDIAREALDSEQISQR